MSAFVSALIPILAKKAQEYAEDWAKKDARSRGTFCGSCAEYPVDSVAAVQAGYSANTKCVFLFPDLSDPLRLVHESGVQYLVGSCVSDGGSTPPPLREPCKEWIDLEPFGKLKRAFFLHDCIYRDGGVFVRRSDDEDWQWMKCTKKMADLIFFQAMTACGANNIECRAIYAAVLVGAGIAWKNHRNRELQSGFTRINGVENIDKR